MSPEAFNFQVLPDPFEKQFILPTILVQSSNLMAESSKLFDRKTNSTSVSLSWYFMRRSFSGNYAL
jgi:hypothetical protein